MHLEDIVSILVTSNQKAEDHENSLVECSSYGDSSDAHYGDLDEQVLDDMSDVLLEINGEQPSQDTEESKESNGTEKGTPTKKPKLQLPGSKAVKAYEHR